MATSEQLNQFIKQQIERLRDAIDLHDLAARYGLQRPGGKGNYKADADDNSLDPRGTAPDHRTR